jgi:ubiquinone/menaquinone biosynthesis C-methylase UbiE
METRKWPKILAPLSPEKQIISNDFMQHWHQVLGNSTRYSFKWMEKFNHNYALKHCPPDFLTTLEIGAGLGEHLHYEKLSAEQKKNYVALDLRENMVAEIKKNFPDIQALVADCQQSLPYEDGHFDRILAIHVLEHLPNLPAAIREIYRLCQRSKGYFSVVIPCEGGVAYSLARKISAQRIFEKRYKQSYDWFIEREHINLPQEIYEELAPYFDVVHQSFFPIPFASINMNICIGITLRPKN